MRRLLLYLGALLLVITFSVVRSSVEARGQPVQTTTPDKAEKGPGLSTYTLDLSQWAIGTNYPTVIVHAGDDRLFIGEKGGRIRLISPEGEVQDKLFLDITGRVGALGAEQGLLGVAFHPQYQENGYFFVHYTDVESNSQISRFSVSADPDLADPDSEVSILQVQQPTPLHNGGEIVFGPDNYLYIGLGDGGDLGDPNNNAQNLSTLLGAILRIDVDGGEGGFAPECDAFDSGNYLIPPDNPFIDGPGGACGEIFLYGLRNPFRFSFDSATGDIYIADVGAENREEVNFLAADSAGGQNFGWRCYEGTLPIFPEECPAPETLTMPVFEYSHQYGCAVLGGDVYRGTVWPELEGKYFFSDHCLGAIWSIQQSNDEIWRARSYGSFFYTHFTGMGMGQDGEMYIANRTLGRILQIGTQPLLLPESNFLPVTVR